MTDNGSVGITVLVRDPVATRRNGRVLCGQLEAQACRRQERSRGSVRSADQRTALRYLGIQYLCIWSELYTCARWRFAMRKSAPKPHRRPPRLASASLRRKGSRFSSCVFCV